MSVDMTLKLSMKHAHGRHLTGYGASSLISIERVTNPTLAREVT